MNKKGFTLIELLAVIVILGIVVAIAIPGINSVIRNSRQKSLNSEAKIIQNAALRKTVGNPTYSFSHINKDNLKSELEADGSKYDYIGIDNNNGKITVTLIKDNFVGYSSNDEEITNAKIYGLHWNGGSNYTRLDDAATLCDGVENCAPVGTDTENPENLFDDADIYKEIIDVEEDGNMFVKIPRFYIKKEVSGNSWTWRISKKKHDEDYYLPAVFQDQERGILLPSVLVGKYNASLNKVTNKLESKSDVIPLTDITYNGFKSYLNNNEKEYHLLDIHTIDLIQVLFTIEFATLYSDSIMSGYVSGQHHGKSDKTVTSVVGDVITISSDASIFRKDQLIDVATKHSGRDVIKNIKIDKISGNTLTIKDVPNITERLKNISTGNIVYNVSNYNGQTDTVKSSSGSYISNSNGKYSMKYRGIENLYGNIAQWVDGINITDRQAYISSDYKTYEPSKFDGAYSKISYRNSLINGSVLKLGYDKNFPMVNLPEVTSTERSPYKDSYEQRTGVNILRYGGSWNHGYSAGLYSWYAKETPNGTIFFVGSRIVKRIN